MNILIINTDIDETKSSRRLNGVDSAITFELYKRYNTLLNLSANNLWDKYTFINEEEAKISTYDTMDELLQEKGVVGNVLVTPHDSWLDKQNPEWRTAPRYQYW